MKPFDTWDALVTWFRDNCYQDTQNGFNRYRPITLRVLTLQGYTETCTWTGRRWRHACWALSYCTLIDGI